jgi:uncharacterized protein
MELTDALRIPLDPGQVRDAFSDLALLRASLDNCESFVRLPGSDYALTLVVPLGALRARYAVRAHLAHGEPGANAGSGVHTLSFKARGAGVGSLRGQIDVALVPDASGASTWIEYTLWATLAGPLADLPPRQIENALREVADDFFAEFCEIVRAKHGQPAARDQRHGVSRRHVFLRPISMSAAFGRRGGAGAHQSRDASAAEAVGGVLLRHRLPGRAQRDPDSHGLPAWAWAAMIGCVAVFVFLAQHFGLP